MTAARLKTMEGFENYSDKTASLVIDQLEEFSRIILRQLNRKRINS